MRNVLILFVATSFLGAQSALALDINIDLLNCPLTVQAGSPVVVNMLLESEECFDVSFPRTFVAIVGNTDDSVGGIGIFGPFARNVSGTIPAVEECFTWPTVPGRLGPLPVTITNNVPASLVGTVAAIVVSIEATGTETLPDLTEETQEGHPAGSCLVEIIAP